MNRLQKETLLIGLLGERRLYKKQKLKISPFWSVLVIQRVIGAT
jgi:hypothetical protein